MTHDLSIICLRAEQAESALEGSGCAHRSTAAWLSLWGMGVRCLHCDCGARRLSLPTQEAHSSATSGPAESMLLAHSSSEELDVMELRQMWHSQLGSSVSFPYSGNLVTYIT